MKEYIVSVECELYDFLRNNVKGSKNNIKSLLSKRMVAVNNKIVTKYNHILKVNDRVSIGKKDIESFIGKIKIIYEDDNFLVVDKPSGMLTIATEEDRENTNNLYNVLFNYLKKRNSNSKLFVVHRLDKDTSGVVLFSKKEKLKDILQDNWNECATRIYYAVVFGKTKEQEELRSYLKEDKNLITHSSSDGKLSITNYKRIKFNDSYSLLEVDIKTGRRNQIRVQLKDIGNPIVGDFKYGKKDKTYKRMYLHASKLIIKNPIDGKILNFESKVPEAFFNLVS